MPMDLGAADATATAGGPSKAKRSGEIGGDGDALKYQTATGPGGKDCPTGKDPRGRIFPCDNCGKVVTYADLMVWQCLSEIP